MDKQKNEKVIPFPDEDQDESSGEFESENEVADDDEIIDLNEKVRRTGYYKVSTPLMLKFDIQTAVFLSLLISMDHRNDQLFRTKAGFFMAKREYVEGTTGLSQKQQMRVTKILKKAGLIIYKRKASAIGWIKLNREAINQVLQFEKSRNKLCYDI